LGGEEFGVLLFPSHPQDAIALAQALRTAVAATCVPGLPGVTVSVGLAPLHAGIETVQSWLMAADVALYAAKAQGRNRVVMA
jgi:diguanylate cyclase